MAAAQPGSILEGSLGPEPNSEFGRMEKAVPRRFDWTPIKPVDAPPEMENSEFAKGLVQRFTFEGSVNESIFERQAIDGVPLKRRRLDILHTSALQDKIYLPVTKSGNTSKQGNALSIKKTKSHVKKALTITGLATTNYGEEHLNQGHPAPTSAFLATTQVRAAEASALEQGDTKKKPRTKTGTKKSRASRKAPPKSRLVSPTSAMKSLNDQSLIFGSASQLAREESPSLIRDTIEATKQSELFLSSDSISPQRTQLTLVEASSQQICTGTSRYVKRRNLWAAAGRDADNALLQIDTIDLSDSPAVRFAFAGKDVLLQPASVAQKDHTSLSTIQNHPHKTPLAHKGGILVDIDDITTPSFNRPNSPTQLQARAYHTSASLDAPRKSPALVSGAIQESTAAKAPQKNSKPTPKKPSFAGLSDHDLQRQISAYGFKAVKKREKMIELLERCWEDKYGSEAPGNESNQEATEEGTVDAMTHADFLSKVHDVSARPVPKVKKPRAKRKSEADPSTTPKEPKRRKKAEPKVKTPKEKAPKKPAPPKRKAKASTLSDEIIHDVDDIESKEQHESPVTEAIVKETKAVKPKTPFKKLAIPPATIPQDVRRSLTSEPHEANEVIKPENPTCTLSETQPRIRSPLQTPPLPDLHSQIRRAIMFRNPAPPSSASHNKSDPSNHTSTSASCKRTKAPTKIAIAPTWREKILMYDPIVLEDLTAWLNTEGFRAINEDRQVTALDVRDWCETNGVCCYGLGGGWRGANGRKRQAPGGVEEE